MQRDIKSAKPQTRFSKQQKLLGSYTLRYLHKAKLQQSSPFCPNSDLANTQTKLLNQFYKSQPRLKIQPIINFTDDLTSYSIGVQIGRGAYASVRSATFKPALIKVAMKIYDTRHISDPKRRANIERQISILTRINHQNIVKLHQTIHANQKIYLILEHVIGNPLNLYLRRFPHKRLDQDHAKKVFKAIIRAVNYLHNKRIVHRDLKLQNILINNLHHVKIIDFGFATQEVNSKTKVFCGTPNYMAPEIVCRKDFTGSQVDIWACGILLFVILCGKFPFKGQNDRELFRNINKGLVEVPNYVSEGAKVLIQQILRIDPNERPSARSILTCMWLKGI